MTREKLNNSLCVNMDCNNVARCVNFTAIQLYCSWWRLTTLVMLLFLSEERRHRIHAVAGLWRGFQGMFGESATTTTGDGTEANRRANGATWGRRLFADGQRNISVSGFEVMKGGLNYKSSGNQNANPFPIWLIQVMTCPLSRARTWIKQAWQMCQMEHHSRHQMHAPGQVKDHINSTEL